MKQLLIADDDDNYRSVLAHHLIKDGFRVLEARNGQEAIDVLEKQPVDMAILDIMMPEIDGLALCENIRKNYDIPIILLTARNQLSDKEQGYASGADDYVTKPAEFMELLYRIKALFRRYSRSFSDKIMLNRFVLDRKNYEVADGEELLFPPLKEFELLAQLAEYPGRVFSREELIRLVWGRDYNGDERTVDVHIMRLRRRFPARESGFAILTIRGIGYKLDRSHGQGCSN